MDVKQRSLDEFSEEDIEVVRAVVRRSDDVMTVVLQPKVRHTAGNDTLIEVEVLARLLGDHEGDLSLSETHEGRKVFPDVGMQIAHAIDRSRRGTPVYGPAYEAAAIDRGVESTLVLADVIGANDAFGASVNVSFPSLLQPAVADALNRGAGKLPLTVELLEWGLPFREDGHVDVIKVARAVAEVHDRHDVRVVFDDLDGVPNGLALPRRVSLHGARIDGMKASHQATMGLRQRKSLTETGLEQAAAEKFARMIMRAATRNARPGEPIDLTYEGLEDDQAVEHLKSLGDFTSQGWRTISVVGLMSANHRDKRNLEGTKALAASLSLPPGFAFLDDFRPELEFRTDLALPSNSLDLGTPALPELR